MKIVNVIACVIIVGLFISLAVILLEGVFAPDEPVRHSNRGHTPEPTEIIEILDVAP